MSQPFAILRQGRIFTLKPWPARVPNPSKFRWAVYCDGTMVGGAKKKEDAEQRINSGWYDDAR